VNGAFCSKPQVTVQLPSHDLVQPRLSVDGHYVTAGNKVSTFSIRGWLAYSKLAHLDALHRLLSVGRRFGTL
jgi:hypothetical protein